MTKLLQRKQALDDSAKDVEETLLKPVERKKPLDYKNVVSTGSTLLDLAVSGGRVRGGGIPAGIIVEIFGPEATGKTAIAAEISASIQARGGNTKFADPEARLDKEYAEIYGLHLDEKEDYSRPDTVTELFDAIWSWETEPGKINGYIADSVAALSTKMEMEDEDKMGMRRAKEFSEGLRKTCRKISTNDKLVVLTNQIRDTAKTMGEATDSTGGHAIKFYSSLRMKTAFDFPSKYIKRKMTLPGEEKKKQEIEKTIGINTLIKVVKSTVDDPYREAPVRIIFGYGIDDIRANLEFLKKIRGTSKFPVSGKEIQGLEAAIKYVEENDLQKDIREQVIDLWEEVERKLKVERKPKVRE